mgnify:CR=1 FL=1
MRIDINSIVNRQLRNKFAILIENKDRILQCRILGMEGGSHSFRA